MKSLIQCLKLINKYFFIYWVTCYLTIYDISNIINYLFLLQAKAVGKVLFEQVCKQLHLLEADYFGLEYSDIHGTKVSPLILSI